MRSTGRRVLACTVLALVSFAPPLRGQSIFSDEPDKKPPTVKPSADTPPAKPAAPKPTPPPSIFDAPTTPAKPAVVVPPAPVAVPSAAAQAKAEKVVREIVVEALIDGDSSFRVTPKGVYWKSHGVAKPGLHDRADGPTFVNGTPWKPKWAKPGDRGHDQCEPFPLAVGDDLDFEAEVVACGKQQGGTTVDKRDPIRGEVQDGEFVVTILDHQIGSRWYRIRIYRR